MSKAATYLRVSTNEQTTENQRIVLHDLAERNQDEIIFDFVDHGVSGSKADREALNSMLAAARAKKFSTLYVLSIDRLGRSVKNLIEVVEQLNALGIKIVFSRESIDTTTAMGQMFLTIVGSIAQFEKSIMIERINAGISRAKKEGKVKFGRPSKLNETVISSIRKLNEQGITAREMSALLPNVSMTTIYKGLQQVQH